MMRYLAALSWLCVTLLFSVTGCQSRSERQGQRTGDYLGEAPPGMKAALFAPAVVSTPLNEDGGPIFTPDGNEIFWRIGGAPFSTFVTMKRRNGYWSDPEIASFSGRYQDAGLSISPDGKTIYFVSKRPISGVDGLSRFNVWMTRQHQGRWQAPVVMGPPVNDPNDYYTRVTVACDGTLIKQSQIPGGRGGWDLYLCRGINGQYGEPENLPGEVNTAFNEYAPDLSPDGRYLVFQSDNRPDLAGAIDLYVSVKRADGTWSAGINLGEAVNTSYVEKWPGFTPDGKFLFFTSDRPPEIKYAQYALKRKTLDEIKALYTFYHAPALEPRGGDVYWISAEIIEHCLSGAGQG